MSLQEIAADLSHRVAEVTAAAPNEEVLRHELENALKEACVKLGIPWTPYQLDRTLFGDGIVRFADVVHGAVIIEYEPPGSFRSLPNGQQVRHAREQAMEYAELTSLEEGRPIFEYDVVVWDGASISFGKNDGKAFFWDRLIAFDRHASTKLLQKLKSGGAPLVSPSVLKSYIGLDSPVGASLIPCLFQAITHSEANARRGHSVGKVNLLFKEWRRIFGQAVGINTERLQKLIDRQSVHHGVDYGTNVPAYLFSMHTYLALVAKLVAALSLPSASQNIIDPAVDLRLRIASLDTGGLFEDTGVINMLSGDFFSYIGDDGVWNIVESSVGDLLASLSLISFDVSKKNPESVRDLFKGIYEVFVPRELRHALGEVYTPDWLASYVLNRVGWEPVHDLLDPTCGTGTFLLEALKRRLGKANPEVKPDVKSLLAGIFGIDLNPLAVLAAKASIVVTLSQYIDPERPVALPVYLADAINIAMPDECGLYIHEIQTEIGRRKFVVPAKIIEAGSLYLVFQELRRLIDADYAADDIWATLVGRLSSVSLSTEELEALEETVVTLHDMHARGWNGIWCSILADRFAAGAVGSVSHIIGNPPWVKWSHLPPEYAAFIKPLCQNLNAFSEDSYVGGIESDISTIITMQAIVNWLAPDGVLGFLITATLFANESSQGFRRMQGSSGEPLAGFLFVEDFKEIAPFDGVTNHPSLMVLRAGAETKYPIPYDIWHFKGNRVKRISSLSQFVDSAAVLKLMASPVPGTDAGPWLRGTVTQHAIWRELFDASVESHYQARKGVTTDLNGVYFVKVGPVEGSRIWVENDPTRGRKDDLPIVRKLIEPTHLFPLMRGRGLSRFSAETDVGYGVLVPQRGMHGDPTLATSAPHTHRYFVQFRRWLEQRASFRRYQAKQPFWSTWSTGVYTFSPFKVLWKEMSGSRFCAAYVGSVDLPGLGRKAVVPDHKLYFVAVASEQEAAYLTGILNSRTISEAVSGYAAQLSLGVSVIEYLKIPPYDFSHPYHLRIAEIAIKAQNKAERLSEADEMELDECAVHVVSSHS